MKAYEPIKVTAKLKSDNGQ